MNYSSSEDFGGKNVHLECLRCGQEMTGKNLEERGGIIKCINCGYKVLRKIRPPIARKHKAN
jgi:DNA-directed RNA polymerase subunit RPC12/RpoP